MTPAELALMEALIEGIEKLYTDYKAAKAALPSATQVHDVLDADVASLAGQAKADDAAADLAEDIRFPPDEVTPKP